MKFFQGLKVVELASVLAAPAVGMFFAELGAEVIKVEHRKKGGDMTRQWKLKNEDPSSPISAYFSSVNYRKEYVDLNLGNPDDLLKLRMLISESDIFLNNMKAKSAQRFGLDNESLKNEYPRLIHCELSGFKHDDSKVAFDAVLQAETGYISMNGSKEHAAKLPVAFIDLMAAHQMKEAILIALLERSKDGKGAHITCSLEESALASLANQASNQLMASHEAIPMGTLHPNIAPYGEIMELRDKVKFMLAIGTDTHFEKLCEILSCKELLKQENYSDNQSRVMHRTALHVHLKNAASKMTATDFEKACLENSVPVGRIKGLAEVMESRVAKEMLREEEIEGKDTKRLSSLAFQISR